VADDDFSALHDLATDIEVAAGVTSKKARQAMQQTAIRTKAEYQKLAAGNPLGRQYTATIDYTIDGVGRGNTSGEITAEVGPNLERYGGKTGKGGLVPSAGIFDDPLSSGSILRPPDRSRRGAEAFAVEELDKGMEIALKQSLEERGLS
jgi:hypothetical protein